MQTDFDLIKYLSNSFIASIIDLSSMCLPHFAKYSKFVDYDCCAIFTIQLYSTAPTVLMSIKFRFITSIWAKKTLKKRTVTFVCTYMSIFLLSCLVPDLHRKTLAKKLSSHSILASQSVFKYKNSVNFIWKKEDWTPYVWWHVAHFTSVFFSMFWFFVSFFGCRKNAFFFGYFSKYPCIKIQPISVNWEWILMMHWFLVDAHNTIQLKTKLSDYWY